MARVVGDIAIQVGADISPLQKQMGKGSKIVKGFGGDTAAMSKKIAKAGAVVATAALAMGAGLLAAGKNAAAAAVKINNLSNVANAGTVEFQKMAAAAATVNISQEKLADILKDVNDRIGDFISTGGGPMKDFFENIAPLVGVTADEFARLSGPEALQLYYTSLEKANLNQQEMTFYLEAMASDTTALIPLLKNGGAAIKQLGDEAQRAGRILDDDLIQNGVKLDKVLGDASDTITTSFNRALLANADEIENIADVIADTLIPAADDLIKKVGEVVEAVSKGTGVVSDFFSIINGGPSSKDTGARSPYDNPDDPDEPPSGTGTHSVDDDGNAVDPVTGKRVRTSSGTGNRGGSGGGSKAPTENDFEKLQEQFATEAEIIQENYEQTLEKLAEYRQRKLGTEEEFNELERRIHKDHLDAQTELEQKAMDTRLKLAQSLFGGLSSLMRTENKKLFEIGKAAAMAGAAVDGFQAAVAAHTWGMKNGGPAVAVTASAVSLLRTGALISSIQSQSIGGGSSGASAGGGGASAGGADDSGGGGSVTQSSFFNVNLAGSGSTDNNSVRELIGLINDEVENGAVIRGITVN